MVAAGLRSMYHVINKHQGLRTNTYQWKVYHVAKKRKLPPSVPYYIGIQYSVSTVLPLKNESSTSEMRRLLTNHCTDERLLLLTAEPKLIVEEALLASIGNRQSA